MSDWIASIDWEAVRAFFTWPRDASVWDLLNSPILVTFLAAVIGWQLNRRVTRAEEKAEDARDLVTLKDEVEAADLAEGEEEEIAPSNPSDSPSADDFRTEAEAVFGQAEAFVKEQMDKAEDGRHRRTYRNIAGASLPIKAGALHQRKGLRQSQYDAAVELAHEWNQYRRGKAARKLVPKSTLDKMRRSLAKLKNG